MSTKNLKDFSYIEEVTAELNQKLTDATIYVGKEAAIKAGENYYAAGKSDVMPVFEGKTGIADATDKEATSLNFLNNVNTKAIYADGADVTVSQANADNVFVGANASDADVYSTTTNETKQVTVDLINAKVGNVYAGGKGLDVASLDTVVNVYDSKVGTIYAGGKSGAVTQGNLYVNVIQGKDDFTGTINGDAADSKSYSYGKTIVNIADWVGTFSGSFKDVDVLTISGYSSVTLKDNLSGVGTVNFCVNEFNTGATMLYLKKNASVKKLAVTVTDSFIYDGNLNAAAATAQPVVLMQWDGFGHNKVVWKAGAGTRNVAVGTPFYADTENLTETVNATVFNEDGGVIADYQYNVEVNRANELLFTYTGDVYVINAAGQYQLGSADDRVRITADATGTAANLDNVYLNLGTGSNAVEIENAVAGSTLALGDKGDDTVLLDVSANVSFSAGKNTVVANGNVNSTIDFGASDKATVIVDDAQTLNGTIDFIDVTGDSTIIFRDGSTLNAGTDIRTREDQKVTLSVEDYADATYTGFDFDKNATEKTFDLAIGKNASLAAAQGRIVADYSKAIYVDAASTDNNFVVMADGKFSSKVMLDGAAFTLRNYGTAVLSVDALDIDPNATAYPVGGTAILNFTNYATASGTVDLSNQSANDTITADGLYNATESTVAYQLGGGADAINFYGDANTFAGSIEKLATFNEDGTLSAANASTVAITVQNGAVAWSAATTFKTVYGNLVVDPSEAAAANAYKIYSMTLNNGTFVAAEEFKIGTLTIQGENNHFEKVVADQIVVDTNGKMTLDEEVSYVDSAFILKSNSTLDTSANDFTIKGVESQATDPAANLVLGGKTLTVTDGIVLNGGLNVTEGKIVGDITAETANTALTLTDTEISGDATFNNTNLWLNGVVSVGSVTATDGENKTSVLFTAQSDAELKAGSLNANAAVFNFSPEEKTLKATFADVEVAQLNVNGTNKGSLDIAMDSIKGDLDDSVEGTVTQKAAQINIFAMDDDASAKIAVSGAMIADVTAANDVTEVSAESINGEVETVTDGLKVTTTTMGAGVTAGSIDIAKNAVIGAASVANFKAESVNGQVTKVVEFKEQVSLNIDGAAIVAAESVELTGADKSYINNVETDSFKAEGSIAGSYEWTMEEGKEEPTIKLGLAQITAKNAEIKGDVVGHITGAGVQSTKKLNPGEATALTVGGEFDGDVKISDVQSGSVKTGFTTVNFGGDVSVIDGNSVEVIGTYVMDGEGTKWQDAAINFTKTDGAQMVDGQFIANGIDDKSFGVISGNELTAEKNVWFEGNATVKSITGLGSIGVEGKLGEEVSEEEPGVLGTQVDLFVSGGFTGDVLAVSATETDPAKGFHNVKIGGAVNGNVEAVGIYVGNTPVDPDKAVYEDGLIAFTAAKEETEDEKKIFQSVAGTFTADVISGGYVEAADATFGGYTEIDTLKTAEDKKATFLDSASISYVEGADIYGGALIGGTAEAGEITQLSVDNDFDGNVYATESAGFNTVLFNGGTLKGSVAAAGVYVETEGGTAKVIEKKDSLIYFNGNNFVSGDLTLTGGTISGLLYGAASIGVKGKIGKKVTEETPGVVGEVATLTINGKFEGSVDAKDESTGINQIVFNGDVEASSVTATDVCEEVTKTEGEKEVAYSESKENSKIAFAGGTQNVRGTFSASTITGNSIVATDAITFDGNVDIKSLTVNNDKKVALMGGTSNKFGSIFLGDKEGAGKGTLSADTINVDGTTSVTGYGTNGVVDVDKFAGGTSNDTLSLTNIAFVTTYDKGSIDLGAGEDTLVANSWGIVTGDIDNVETLDINGEFTLANNNILLKNDSWDGLTKIDFTGVTFKATGFSGEATILAADGDYVFSKDNVVGLSTAWTWDTAKTSCTATIDGVNLKMSEKDNAIIISKVALS